MNNQPNSTELEQQLRKHTHYDRLGVETVELPLVTLKALIASTVVAELRAVQWTTQTGKRIEDTKWYVENRLAELESTPSPQDPTTSTASEQQLTKGQNDVK